MAPPTAQLTFNLASVSEQVVTAVKDSLDKIGNEVVSASKPPDPERPSLPELKDLIICMLVSYTMSGIMLTSRL